MTIIIGYVNKENNSVFMSGDSRTTQDSYYDTMNVKKVFIKNDFIIGASGTLRLINILKHKFIPPKYPNRINRLSIDEYMNTLFIDEVRLCFINNGLRQGREPDQDYNGAFLVGYKGRLFEVGCDFAINESQLPFATLGSGSLIASGSLMTTLYDDISIEEKINKALEVTGKLDCGVGPPYYTLELTN